ncbi:MAG: hypothetical protein LDL33_02410 [Desulfomonile sp.]|nr:hypothetical protein [Desulfomonile sp.]
MLLAVSIDVEEEGLFSRQYESAEVTANNVRCLQAVDPIFQEFGIRPTLLVSYQVMRHPEHWELLTTLGDRWDGELGAHLHAWNTPPLRPLPFPEPVPSELMPEDLLDAKMNSLLETFRAVGCSPVSFRMGRFNIGPKMLAILERKGFHVDGSIAPMRRYYGGPERLDGLVDPYFPDRGNPYRPGDSPILEVPMTIVPVVKGLGSLLERFGKQSRAAKWASWFAMNLGSLPAQPAWTGLKRLKAAVRLHRARGGVVLSVFFHSSELIPGGYPGHGTAEDVRRFLDKLRGFFSWLHAKVGVESITFAGLREKYKEPNVAASLKRHTGQ